MSEGCAILEPLVSFTNVKGACFLHVKSLECEKLVTCAIVDPFSMCEYHQDCAPFTPTANTIVRCHFVRSDYFITVPLDLGGPKLL